MIKVQLSGGEFLYNAKPPHVYSLPHSSCPTHCTVDILAALLVLLLNPLLQEVDAELEAEVLLLQVIQVLR